MEDIKVKIKENKKEGMDFKDHPAGMTNTIFPRTFRWTLKSKISPDICFWMQVVKTDYLNKKISLEIYDDAKGEVYDWIHNILSNTNDELYLNHLDRTGTEISEIKFLSISVLDHHTEYDYSKSEILTHRLVLSYQKIKRVNCLNVI